MFPSPIFALTEFIEEQGGKVLDVFRTTATISAVFPTASLRELKSRPEVAFVESDGGGTGSEDTVGWGVVAVQAPAAWNTSTGQAVRIAVLDTGIDYEHPDLTEVVKGGVDFTGSQNGYKDVQGHGTHMAGILAASMNGLGTVGVAYQAEIYAVKVLRDSDGWGYYSWWIKGIEWAVENHMQVVSMSLGGTTDSEALRRTVDLAYSKGLLIVAAAGNAAESSDAVLYPARYESVVAVGALDSNSNLAGFSRRGPELELVAPGVSIYTTALGASYAYSSGTSAATPFVAAAAALTWAVNQKLNNTQVRRILDETACDMGPEGWDASYGYGLVNALKAVTLASKMDDSLMNEPQTVTVGNPHLPAQSIRELAVVGNKAVTVARGSYSSVSLTLMGTETEKREFVLLLPGLPSGVSVKVSKTPCAQTSAGATFKIVFVAGLNVLPGEYEGSILAVADGQNNTLPIRIVVEENSLVHSVLNPLLQWSSALSRAFTI